MDLYHGYDSGAGTQLGMPSELAEPVKALGDVFFEKEINKRTDGMAHLGLQVEAERAAGSDLLDIVKDPFLLDDDLFNDPDHTGSKEKTTAKAVQSPSPDSEPLQPSESEFRLARAAQTMHPDEFGYLLAAMRTNVGVLEDDWQESCDFLANLIDQQ
ncbi:hypothetical protein CF328_g9193, partial [Tilletia controversa]